MAESISTQGLFPIRLQAGALQATITSQQDCYTLA
jgi:hypothetical protein